MCTWQNFMSTTLYDVVTTIIPTLRDEETETQET